MGAAATKLAAAPPPSVCHCEHSAGWHGKYSGGCTFPGCKCRQFSYSVKLSHRPRGGESVNVTA